MSSVSNSFVFLTIRTTIFFQLFTVQDGSIDSPDNRYHDTTGKSIHGSPHEILAPKLQHGLVQSPYIMMNVHGFKRQGEAVDAVIDCTNLERNANTTHNCQALSLFNPPKQHSQVGPFGFITPPIFPANDPDTLTGFIFGAVFWSEVMLEMVRFFILGSRFRIVRYTNLLAIKKGPVSYLLLYRKTQR